MIIKLALPLYIHNEQVLINKLTMREEFSFQEIYLTAKLWGKIRQSGRVVLVIVCENSLLCNNHYSFWYLEKPPFDAPLHYEEHCVVCFVKVKDQILFCEFL